MEDILLKVHKKRAELLALIEIMIEHYNDRAQVFAGRARRLRIWAVGFAIIGIFMLGTFVVENEGSTEWMLFGVVSIAFIGVGAIVISFFERRHERAVDCLDRAGELVDFAASIREDELTLESAEDDAKWYTSRTGILMSEYLDSQKSLGSIEFEELIAPPTERADKLLNSIGNVARAVSSGAVVGDSAQTLADALSAVKARLAD